MTSEAGRVGVRDWNLRTDEIYIDPLLKRLLGYEDHEMGNTLEDWFQRVHPDDRESVQQAVKRYLQGRTSKYEVEHRMVHKDGSIRWFLARGTLIHDPQGVPFRMMGTEGSSGNWIYG